MYHSFLIKKFPIVNQNSNKKEKLTSKPEISFNPTKKLILPRKSHFYNESFIKSMQIFSKLIPFISGFLLLTWEIL